MKSAATNTGGTRRTFSSARYLEQLMGELDRAAISVRLQQSRDEAGLTQPEMGEALSVHWRTIQDWESARKRVIPFDRLDEWAAITGVSKQWLLHGEPATEPDEGELAQRLLAVEEVLRELQRELLRRLPAVPGVPGEGSSG